MESDDLQEGAEQGSEPGSEQEPQTKQCSDCGEIKPLDQFGLKGGRLKKGVERPKASFCLTCHAVRINARSSGKPLEEKIAERKLQRKEREIAKQIAQATPVEQKRLIKEAARKRASVKNAKNKKYKADKAAATKEIQELANRELAKRQLVHFIQRFDNNYEAGWVHHDICRRLERFYRDVKAKKSPRLMLFVPPRHGKSYIASDFFPSWVLGHSPDMKFISASYAVSLPIGFSRNVRARVQDPLYKAMFPHTALSKDSKSAETWETTKGGMFIAAGVGGGITGKGADIFVIDDPIKDAEEADSEVVRDKVWDWYGSTAYTRLSPGGGMLVIQTRWHDDDLSGRLIMQMNELQKELIEGNVIEGAFDDWEIIKYPAEATHDEYMVKGGRIVEEPPETGRFVKLRSEGDALHEERFSWKLLQRIKATMQPRHWSALYQQNPVPEEGIYFTKDMFRYEETVDYRRMKVFIAGDLAIGEKEDNDYTVFAVGALDYDDVIHVLDIIRFRGDTFKIVENLLDLVQVYDPYLVGIEKGQLELAIMPQLRKRMRERKLYPTLAEGKEALKPIQDKWKRARPMQGRMQQGMVRFPNTQPWVETAVAELLRFPGGVHDDIVDALAWLVRMAVASEPPRRPKKQQHKSWKDKIHRYIKDDHGVRTPMAS